MVNKNPEFIWKLKGIRHAGHLARWAEKGNAVWIMTEIGGGKREMTEITGDCELVEDSYLRVGDRYYTLGEKIRYVDFT